LKHTASTYYRFIGLIFTFCLFQCAGTISAKRPAEEKGVLVKDSIKTITSNSDVIPDSLTNEFVTPLKSRVGKDTLLSKRIAKVANDPKVTTLVEPKDTVYKPDPLKAVWYSALFPGLGQIYNHRYWKLPVVGAGIVAISYGISWNNKYYIAYTNAYRDISDNDDNTDSYIKLLPNASKNYTKANLTTILKNRQQIYRRSRDLSLIGAVGIYLICILDAYVDAQLYDFDISPDLSLQPSIDVNGFGGSRGVAMSLSFSF